MNKIILINLIFKMIHHKLIEIILVDFLVILIIKINKKSINKILIHNFLKIFKLNRKINYKGEEIKN
jgi:hypothetical protein